jgi:hypothetical protein
MTAQLMEWSGAALMNEGGKDGGGECEVRRLELEPENPEGRAKE